MQSVDDVHLGERLPGTLPELTEDLLERHRVGAWIARLQAGKRTEQARRFADVGRFEPQVVIEVGARAVPPLALAVGEPADGEQVRSVEQADAVLERQACAAFQLVGNVGEIGRFET